MALLKKSERSGREKRAWTFQEDLVLVKATQEGYTASAIAETLGTHGVLSVRYRQGWHRDPETPGTEEELAAYHKKQSAKRTKPVVGPKPGAMVQPVPEEEVEGKE